MDEDSLYKIVVGLASVAAAVAARNTASAGWRRVTGRQPPTNPAAPDTSWRAALLWTMFTGALVGVARLVARRGAAGIWQRMQGELPPAVEEAE